MSSGSLFPRRRAVLNPSVVASCGSVWLQLSARATIDPFSTRIHPSIHSFVALVRHLIHLIRDNHSFIALAHPSIVSTFVSRRLDSTSIRRRFDSTRFDVHRARASIARPRPRPRPISTARETTDIDIDIERCGDGGGDRIARRTEARDGVGGGDGRVGVVGVDGTGSGVAKATSVDDASTTRVDARGARGRGGGGGARGADGGGGGTGVGRRRGRCGRVFEGEKV